MYFACFRVKFREIICRIYFPVTFLRPKTISINLVMAINDWITCLYWSELPSGVYWNSKLVVNLHTLIKIYPGVHKAICHLKSFRKRFDFMQGVSMYSSIPQNRHLHRLTMYTMVIPGANIAHFLQETNCLIFRQHIVLCRQVWQGLHVLSLIYIVC